MAKHWNFYKYEGLKVESPNDTWTLPDIDNSKSWKMNLCASYEDTFFLAVDNEIRLYRMPHFHYSNENSSLPFNKKELHFYRTLKMPKYDFSERELLQLKGNESINAIKVGKVGLEPVLVSVTDQGLVCIFFFTEVLKKPIVFFNQISTWGIAIDSIYRRIAVSCNGHYITLFNLKNNVRRVLKGHDDNIPYLDFNANSNRLVSCSIDGSCCVWDVKYYKLIDRIQLNSGYLWSVNYVNNFYNVIHDDTFTNIQNNQIPKNDIRQSQNSGGNLLHRLSYLTRLENVVSERSSIDTAQGSNSNTQQTRINLERQLANALGQLREQTRRRDVAREARSNLVNDQQLTQSEINDNILIEQNIQQTESNNPRQNEDSNEGIVSPISQEDQLTLQTSDQSSMQENGVDNENSYRNIMSYSDLNEPFTSLGLLNNYRTGSGIIARAGTVVLRSNSTSLNTTDTNNSDDSSNTSLDSVPHNAHQAITSIPTENNNNEGVSHRNHVRIRMISNPNNQNIGTMQRNDTSNIDHSRNNTSPNPIITNNYSPEHDISRRYETGLYDRLHDSPDRVMPINISNNSSNDNTLDNSHSDSSEDISDSNAYNSADGIINGESPMTEELSFHGSPSPAYTIHTPYVMVNDHEEGESLEDFINREEELNYFTNARNNENRSPSYLPSVDKEFTYLSEGENDRQRKVFNEMQSIQINLEHLISQGFIDIVSEHYKQHIVELNEQLERLINIDCYRNRADFNLDVVYYTELIISILNNIKHCLEYCTLYPNIYSVHLQHFENNVNNLFILIYINIKDIKIDAYKLLIEDPRIRNMLLQLKRYQVNDLSMEQDDLEYKEYFLVSSMKDVFSIEHTYKQQKSELKVINRIEDVIKDDRYIPIYNQFERINMSIKINQFNAFILASQKGKLSLIRPLKSLDQKMALKVESTLPIRESIPDVPTLGIFIKEEKVHDRIEGINLFVLYYNGDIVCTKLKMNKVNLLEGWIC